MNPSGLIVDFGGVLTTSVLDSFRKFCEEHRISPQQLRDAILAEIVVDGATAPAVHFVETGRLAIEEFNTHLARALSDGSRAPLVAEGFDERLFGALRPEVEMIEAVRRIRGSGVATALLSNSWGRNDYPLAMLEELFDVLVLSGEVGVRKPEPEVYLLAAEKIGREPDACVFVDDFEENVRGAEAVGMVGLHHREPAETIAALKDLFGL